MTQCSHTLGAVSASPQCEVHSWTTTTTSTATCVNFTLYITGSKVQFHVTLTLVIQLWDKRAIFISISFLFGTIFVNGQTMWNLISYLSHDRKRPTNEMMATTASMNNYVVGHSHRALG